MMDLRQFCGLRSQLYYQLFTYLVRCTIVICITDYHWDLGLMNWISKGGRISKLQLR